MSLTLGNQLSGTVSRETKNAVNNTSNLGDSLTTGNNKSVEVVDGFLGSSLRDKEIMLGAPGQLHEIYNHQITLS